MFSTVDPEMEDVMAFLNVKSYNVADIPNSPMNGTPNPRQTVISEQSRKTGDFLDEELYVMDDIPYPRPNLMAGMSKPRETVNFEQSRQSQDFRDEDMYVMDDMPYPRPNVIVNTPPAVKSQMRRRTEDVEDILEEESYEVPISRPMVNADITKARPMVNSKLLRKYMGRRVTTVIKVRRVEKGKVVGELPDGVLITVHKIPQHIAAQSMFVEVVGVVESDRLLRAQTCTGFGDNFGKYRVIEAQNFSSITFRWCPCECLHYDNCKSSVLYACLTKETFRNCC